MNQVLEREEPNIADEKLLLSFLQPDGSGDSLPVTTAPRAAEQVAAEQAAAEQAAEQKAAEVNSSLHRKLSTAAF